MPPTTVWNPETADATYIRISDRRLGFGEQQDPAGWPSLPTVENFADVNTMLVRMRLLAALNRLGLALRPGPYEAVVW